MALVFIGEEAVPSYVCLSTDIVDLKITGAVLVGKLVFATDSGIWYIIKKDLTLSQYVLPISIAGGVTIGTVNQGNPGALDWPVVADGRGTAGTPVGGVLTVQGDPVMMPLLTNAFQPLGQVYDVNTSSTNLSVVDAGNSSSVNLAANATFTGTFTDLSKYINLSIMAGSDVASALNGLVLQWSIDGVSVDDTDIFTIAAGTHKQFSFGITAKYARLVYTNGSAPQTSFRLQLMLHRSAPKPSSHRIQDTIVDEDDAELQKAVITARRPDGTYKNVGSTQDGVLLVGIDDIQADAASRVRVSSLSTLGDYKIIGFDRTLLIESAGTGTGTYGGNKFNMSVTSGQYYIRQSKRFHAYFSGKSQIVEETFDNFAPQANVTKRVGYFSSNSVAPYQSNFDGFWLESGGGTITLKVQRTGVSVLSVPLASMSGYANIAEYKNVSTWDNFTVVLFDFLWLGGAVLRLWVKTSLGFIVAHEFNYSGTSQDTFITSPVQPVRYEIVSTTGTGSFRQICSQVATEGSIGESGTSRFVDSGTFITVATVGTTYPIKAIRKAASFRDVPGIIDSLDMTLASVNDRVKWTLQLNPTLSAPLTYTAVTNSAKEEASGNGTITVTTPGTVIAGGAVVSNAYNVSEQLNLNFLAWLGGTLNGTMDAYVLCATPLTANAGVFGGIGWKEY